MQVSGSLVLLPLFLLQFGKERTGEASRCEGGLTGNEGGTAAAQNYSYCINEIASRTTVLHDLPKICRLPTALLRVCVYSRSYIHDKCAARACTIRIVAARTASVHAGVKKIDSRP